MRRRFLDAMTLVQEDGRPDIFLLMTCNPNWKEIVDELLPGQTAQDRPDLVARVFRAKLEDLKVQLLKMNFIGEVGAHVYVVEFQKRGLPHAHFLLIMRPRHKITNPDDYDKIVCAEISDPIKYPAMHDLVKNHMIHGTCGSLREKSPCMEGVPKKCRFRWVAPYNPKLRMMFNYHIKVEVCLSIKSVKYIFKYVYKGHDKHVIHIDQDRENNTINEIRRFQDACYVCPPEAMWQIFSFPLSQIHPYVMSLKIHPSNQQLVRFKDGDRMEDIVERENDKNSMLMEFFEKNKEDSNARKYMYKDFLKKFTWNSSTHRWSPRKQKSMIGRLVYANPIEGERYYLRLL
ncbi:unnamed protein product [Lactuca virosa]|uniref:Helitron helicase-like domain-containing protein n=1 Tax=Lactuca virosa TaxID=75947 RepID=A0AAU9PH49_9ASTR|nr:unnamed protein product [Lactuca virosa]